MELDEFKKHWNVAQEEDLKQQEHTKEAINKIIMSTTTSLGELKEKSIYWRRMGGWNAALMILLVIVYMLMQYFRSGGSNNLTGKLPLIAVLIGFALFSWWTYNRQEEIFSDNSNESLKEAFRNTLINFKRYYRFTNVIFLLISPVAFYAVFDIFLKGIDFSLTAIMLTSVSLTAISFLIRIWYYKTVYFKRIKAMESDLSELENIQGY